MADGKIPQGVIVWAATGFAALAIIVVAVIAVHRHGRPDMAQQETAGVSAPSAPETTEKKNRTAPRTATATVTAKTTTAPSTSGATGSSRRTGAPALSAVPFPEPPPSPSPIHPQLELSHLAGTLRVALPDTPKGAVYPLTHTCYRLDQSPAVTWRGVPSGARSMVVVLERRAPGKPHAWLWALFNLAPSSDGIPANIPKIAQLNGGARQARNVYGKAAYTGPCEPHGNIPYAIRLFALNVPLGVAAGASRDDLVRGMNGHIIDAAEYDFVHHFRD